MKERRANPYPVHPSTFAQRDWVGTILSVVMLAVVFGILAIITSSLLYH